MIREVFVCLAIIILILVGNFFSQNYTSKSVAELTEKIDELKQEVSKSEQDETVNKNKTEELYNTWRDRFNILAYYIEHTELEKVEAELVVLRGKVANLNYNETSENLEKSAFLLKHIEDKYAFNLQNVF